MVLNKPTPEKAYTVFESVWPDVVDNADAQACQQLSRSLLSVLGKNIAVTDDHKAILKKSLSWAVYTMTADSARAPLAAAPNETAVDLAKTTIGLGSTGFEKIMVDLLPTSLVKVETDQLGEDCKKALPGIMKLYLVHNRSALTDFKFIGFPFHYWYTAQFLLIMFVVLCLIYAMYIDKINKKYDFVEEA
jgi:putative solute:sodium symporter small subunit